MSLSSSLDLIHRQGVGSRICGASPSHAKAIPTYLLRPIRIIRSRATTPSSSSAGFDDFTRCHSLIQWERSRFICMTITWELFPRGHNFNKSGFFKHRSQSLSASAEAPCYPCRHIPTTKATSVYLSVSERP